MKKVNLLLKLALVLSIVGCQQEKQAGLKISEKTKNVHVQTAVAKAPNIVEQLNYSGIVTPSVSTKLSFQLPGSVAKIYVEEGGKVRAGQVLGELDNTAYESSHKAALAMKNQAQDAYTRLQSVYEKGSLPEIQWEEIKSKLEQANSAEAIARKNMENCKITSPTEGIIGSRNMEIGTSVMPGVPVIDLVNINDVLVKISVPENEINKIRKNQTADVVIPAINREVLNGNVKTIGVMANQLSKTYEVKLIVKNPTLTIKPGMVCDVNISIPINSQTVALPIQAILKDAQGNDYVYVVDKESNTAKKVTVSVGEIIQNHVQVLSGISLGEEVVVKGQHKLNDNAQVVLN